MTREEAIDVLKHNYPSSCFTELCEAVEIAIHALSAQPEIIRCNSCRHDNNCAIQDIAQTGGKFFCGFARLKGEQP